MGKAWKHFKKICTHKYYVAQYCFQTGLYWQGIVHDLSKFSPAEFGESMKYYMGTSSPIDEAKKDKGYSEAWMHHKSRNKHHYEYWQDNFDSGTTHVKMPFKYVLEYVCDIFAASKAYNGKKFTNALVLDWWNKKKIIAAMNPETKTAVSFLVEKICYEDDFKKVMSDKEFIKDIKYSYDKNIILVSYNKWKSSVERITKRYGKL